MLKRRQLHGKGTRCTTLKHSFIGAVVALCAQGAWTGSLAEEARGYPFPEHIDQKKIKSYPIESLYKWGGEIFKAPFNHLDGSGRNFRDDPIDEIRMPYSRIPRADLPGFVSDPIRMSGPGARNCKECHNSFNGNIQNSLFDFRRSGNIADFAERNTPNIAGMGPLQLIAEQTSKELWKLRDDAIQKAQETGMEITVEMVSSNNIHYGSLVAFPDGSLDTSAIYGVEAKDNFFLLSKQFQVVPYYLKGEVGFLRITSATSPTGLQSPEMYPADVDGDNDGVVGELSTGDVTAITVYTASQPRPVTKLELHTHLGGKFKLKREEIKRIKTGEVLFGESGCANCHTPALVINDATFREPSATPGYSFPFFWNKYFKDDGSPGFTDPRPLGYDIADPLEFSLRDLASIPCKRGEATRDGDNYYGRPKKPSAADKTCWREYELAGDNGIVIRAYSDLKRYDMGEGLADPVPSFGFTPGSIWRTKPLWGVGSTGPWLHDGRATTLYEAIRWHKGDADYSRELFFNMSEQEQDAIIDFLNNLVIYNPQEDAVQHSGMGFPNS